MPAHRNRCAGHGGCRGPLACTPTRSTSSAARIERPISQVKPVHHSNSPLTPHAHALTVFLPSPRYALEWRSDFYLLQAGCDRRPFFQRFSAADAGSYPSTHPIDSNRSRTHRPVPQCPPARVPPTPFPTCLNTPVLRCLAGQSERVSASVGGHSLPPRTPTDPPGGGGRGATAGLLLLPPSARRKSDRVA